MYYVVSCVLWGVGSGTEMRNFVEKHTNAKLRQSQTTGRQDPPVRLNTERKLFFHNRHR